MQVGPNFAPQMTLLVKQCLIVALFLVVGLNFVVSAPVLTHSDSKFCTIVDGIRKYKNVYVDDFIPCPDTITDCDGIGARSSLNCYKCCINPKAVVVKKCPIERWMVMAVAFGSVVAVLLFVGFPVTCIIVKSYERKRNESSEHYIPWLDNHRTIRSTSGDTESLNGSLSSLEQASTIRIVGPTQEF